MKGEEEECRRSFYPLYLNKLRGKRGRAGAERGNRNRDGGLRNEGRAGKVY